MHASALGFVILSAVALAGEQTPGVRIVKGTAIADKIDRAAPSPGGRGGVFAEGEGYRVFVAERDGPGLSEVHDTDTDVWYVIAGGGTVVTGGALVDSKDTEPGEHRGSGIKGGAETTVAAGDVVTIQAGIPHWVKAVDGKLRYMVVKVQTCPVPPGKTPSGR
jgi:mannose-6-phosphate isomerase-like protein (cupin superfamily)